MVSERDAEKLSRGNLAVIAKTHYESILLKRRDLIMKELCNLYRAGTLELPVLAGKLGALVTIDDVLLQLDREINQASQIEGKLHDNP